MILWGLLLRPLGSEIIKPLAEPFMLESNQFFVTRVCYTDTSQQERTVLRFLYQKRKFSFEMKEVYT